MNNNNNNLRQSKLLAEKTAFKYSKEDMSDVSFEIGKSSYTAKVFGMMVLFALFFGGRFLIRKFVGNTNNNLSVVDIIFWGIIALVGILVVVTVIREKKKPTIFVKGKKIFYNGDQWTSDEIVLVRCTKWLERIEVYSHGRKILNFSWEMDNAELFIAWVNKCGIAFEDNRMTAFQ